ncbi:MAG: A/G-specific adenine glycosylase [Sideroxydans sp.]
MSFASRLVAWQCTHGRHDLPWQGQDAYRIWLSEVMLQQTQVVTVIPYYRRFIESFPCVATLAAASEERVLAHWSGLGYYARGRNLHRAARLIVARHEGEFPHEFSDIHELPGIGRSTAAAICALAYHERRAVLDGNVKRVLARHFGIEGWPGKREVEENLWRQAEASLPQQDVAIYTQALMDLGATVCIRGRPKCVTCPVQADCVALRTERTAELPAMRPRQVVPERHTIFLLLIHGGDILLEKRPGNGIWGGLWCPPQFDAESAAMAWFVRNGMEASTGERLDTFVHTFTHFKLHITPLRVELAHKAQRTAQPGSVWLDLTEALGAAIPTPVRRLLQELVRTQVDA